MRTRLRDWPVWRMARLWLPDQRMHSAPVRLSLPWHGPASWDDLHAYVTKVITDNLVPNNDRARWGGMSDQEQAERFARGILLSVCHRLGIEPVGAFVFHLPDDEREEWEASHGGE